MQTDNKVLDQLARFLTNAAGVAQAFRAEMETMVKGRFDRLLADLDLVPREEFDAVKAMAAKARSENEKLAARVTDLEARLGLASAKTRLHRLARARSGRPRKPARRDHGKL